MKMFANILSVVVMVMSVILLPLGTVVMHWAFDLGLWVEGMTTLVIMSLYTAAGIYELREYILDLISENEEYEAVLQEVEVSDDQ